MSEAQQQPQALPAESPPTATPVTSTLIALNVGLFVADLAAASRGTFYLLDLAPAPDPADPDVALFRKDREALKQKLIAAVTAAGERPTPAKIEKQIMAVERREAALRAVEAVEAVGGTVVGVNDTLNTAPATVNEDAEGKGWFLKLKLKDSSELDALMSEQQYQEFLKSIS